MFEVFSAYLLAIAEKQARKTYKQTDRQTHTRDDYHMPLGLRPPRHNYLRSLLVSTAHDAIAGWPYLMPITKKQ